MDAMPREFCEKTWTTKQDNEKEPLATCGTCGGVDGLDLQNGMVAATCVCCFEASKAAEPPKPILVTPAKAKAAEAKAASAQTALPRRASLKAMKQR